MSEFAVKSMPLRAITWDDDCEQVVLENPKIIPGATPQPHPHHGMPVILKKTANSVTIEPMYHQPLSGQAYHFNERITYVRTTSTDTSGRVIFRQGVA